MFRHVVMFRWTEESSPGQREAAITRLRSFAEGIRDLGTLRVGEDAGVSEGNYDAVVVADFADRDGYLAYAKDPRHLTLIAERLKPIIAARAAVQAELD